MLCNFLRENQYALYHDISGSLFSNKEIQLLHRAFEVLRKHEAIVYDKLSIPILGTILARTPLRALEIVANYSRKTLESKNLTLRPYKSRSYSDE